MRIALSRVRFPVAILAGAAIITGLAVASLAPRDLAKQLEYINAATNGVVVYGTVTNSRVVESPFPEVECVYTVLTVDVAQSLVGNASGALTVYTSGGNGQRLSVSCDESEVRVGEKVLYFLRVDDQVRKHDASAYILDNYGAAFRTQTNRKGGVVVLGEGAGSAIENNVMLADLQVSALNAVKAMKKPK